MKVFWSQAVHTSLSVTPVPLVLQKLVCSPLNSSRSGAERLSLKCRGAVSSCSVVVEGMPPGRRSLQVCSV